MIKKISDLLGTGESQAIHVSELAKMIDADSRSVRRLVAELRRDGTPILSNVHGYFMPADSEELKKFVAAMRRRSRSALDAISFARQKKSRDWSIPGQISLFD